MSCTWQSNKCVRNSYEADEQLILKLSRTCKPAQNN